MLFLAVLLGQLDVLFSNLPTAIISATVYLLVGNRIFVRADNSFYNNALTMFIAAYGVVVLFNSRLEIFSG